MFTTFQSNVMAKRMRSKIKKAIGVGGPEFVSSFKKTKGMLITNKGYFILYPPNDGVRDLPLEYYIGDEKVFDNKKAFAEIEGIDIFISKCADLFTFCLNNNLVINPFRLFAKLDMKQFKKDRRLVIDLNFPLAIDLDSLSYNNFHTNEKDKEIRIFLNELLDCFIGWNFGKILLNSKEIEAKYISINEALISSKLREAKSLGRNIDYSEDVVHYKFKT